MRAAFLLLFSLPLLAAAPPLLIPAALHDDFSANGLSQWVSYPPAQDIGYEPSITPTGDGALARVVRPPSAGLFRLGFLKRTTLVAKGSLAVSFRYRATPLLAGAEIEVGAAYADGRREFQRLPAPAGDSWRTVTLQLPAPATPTALDAVYLVLRLPHPEPETDQRFVIDDVDVRAFTRAHFEFAEPRAAAIAPWVERISAAAVVPGSSLTLSARAPAALSAVTLTVTDPAGRPVVSRPMDRAGELWRAAHPLRTDAPTGVWKATLAGATASGDRVETTLRFLVRRPRAAVHPRLYFDRAGQAALAARTRDPRLAPSWKTLSEASAAARQIGDLEGLGRMFPMLDSRYLLPSLPGYFDVLTRGSRKVLYSTLDYAVSGDAAAAEAGRQALLAIAGWPTWTPPWFAAHGQHTYYPVGEMMSDIAFAYDVLPLSDADRQTIRQALIEKGIAPTVREYVDDNRLMSNTSNWLGHTVGGALLALTAIADDAPEDPQLNLLLGGLLLKWEDHLAASYLADGSYGEGISYQEFDLKTTTLTLEALDRVLGLDYWSSTHVKDSYRFARYANPLDQGDSHSATGNTAALLMRHGAPAADRAFWERLAPRSFHTFLFAPLDAAPAVPAEPPSNLFAQKGVAILRSGWDATSTQLYYRAGPNHNHNHADQGALLLRAYGEDLVTEAGFAHYYNDPYYQSYFTQAAGHSTILVNGDDASQEVADTLQFPALKAYPRIERTILGPAFSALTSELVPVYKDRLTSLRRDVVFLPPDIVLIADQTTAPAPVELTWRLHLPDLARTRREGASVLYSGAKAALAVRPLAGAAAEALHPGRFAFGIFNPTAPKTVPAQPAILDYRQPAAAGSRLLHLLAIGPTADQAAQLAAGARPAEGALGVTIDGRTVLFRDPAAAELTFGAWRSDAAILALSGDAIAGAVAITRLTRSGEVVFEANHPVHLTAEAGALHLEAAEPVTIRWQGRAETLPAGRHTLRR